MLDRPRDLFSRIDHDAATKKFISRYISAPIPTGGPSSRHVAAAYIDHRRRQKGILLSGVGILRFEAIRDYWNVSHIMRNAGGP